MKTIRYAAAIAGIIMFAPGTAALAAGDLGEYGNNCAFGLTKGVKKYTDCSVHEKIDGKLYCFSKQAAKEEFMKDSKANVAKATSFYNDNQQ